MDGFSSIPIQNVGGVAPTSNNNLDSALQTQQFSTAPYKDKSVVTGDGIEIADDSVQKKEKNSFGWLFPLSIFSLFAVFGYFGYLVFMRMVTIEQITVLSENFQVLSQNINKGEIEEFIALDNSLKAVNEKLSKHTQLASVFSFVNRNIRSNVLISDYRVESREKEVMVSLSSIAPSFKELAEQTEKMSELKTTGALKDFQVSQMSLESDGRRIRYTLSLTFDKSKISVAVMARQNELSKTNNISN